MERSEDFSDLEGAFFSKANARHLEELRRKVEHQERRDALRRVVAVKNDAFLDRLIMLGVGPERALVLRLTPLVFVAWADGSIDARERDAILRAAAQQGLAADEMVREVLGDWLERKPDPRLLQKWKDYVRHIWGRFAPDEQLALRKNLLGATHEVAKAAGGILGLATISAAERKLLEELDEVVS